MVVYGAATLGCAGKFVVFHVLLNVLSMLVAGAGYLVGPIVGSALWRFMNRHTMKLIEARDRVFHKHITKNRVDPTAQSATNPVPDFYGKKHLSVRFVSLLIHCYTQGEKIGSLHDYRQVRILDTFTRDFKLVLRADITLPVATRPVEVQAKGIPSGKLVEVIDLLVFVGLNALFKTSYP